MSDHQKHLCSSAAGRISRVYEAIVMARDELGMTRHEFRINIARRPEFYEPVAFLADCDAFWKINMENRLVFGFQGPHRDVAITNFGVIAIVELCTREPKFLLELPTGTVFETTSRERAEQLANNWYRNSTLKAAA